MHTFSLAKLSVETPGNHCEFSIVSKWGSLWCLEDFSRAQLPLVPGTELAKL